MVSKYLQASVTDSVSSVLSANSNRKKLILKNIGENKIYVGGDNSLTASTGYPIEAGDILKLDDYLGELFAICDSSLTSTLNILEEELI